MQRIELPVDATGFVMPVGAPLLLPDNEGPRFIISVDTEEEFDWSKPFDRYATRTDTIARMPFATKRFNEVGAKPTFLCVYPVVDHPASAEIMAQLAAEERCEIGAHLHPWVTPPFEEELSRHNSYTGNLPVGLQKAKLRHLTEKITQAVGKRPLVYRAGRYGIGPSTAAILEENGYRIDASVRPLFNYACDGGPDFRSHPNHAWRTAEGVLEVPLTTATLGPLRQQKQFAGETLASRTLARLGLISRVPLTPEGIPLATALEAIRVLHGEGQQLFCFSFHSPSAAIGFTPYVRDEADLKEMWRWWASVLTLLHKLGIKPSTYSDLLKFWDDAR